MEPPFGGRGVAAQLCSGGSWLCLAALSAWMGGWGRGRRREGPLGWGLPGSPERVGVPGPSVLSQGAQGGTRISVPRVLSKAALETGWELGVWKETAAVFQRSDTAAGFERRLRF